MSNSEQLSLSKEDLQREATVRQQRLENAREAAEKRVRDRRFRLRLIQDHDRQLEKRLLFHGIDANVPESEPWFVSEDMSGERNYILQYMGTIMKKYWSKEVLEQIEQLASNMEWIRNPFPGHQVDTDAASYVSKDHVLSLLRTLSMNRGLMDNREKTPLFMSDKIWDHLKAAFQLLDQLCLLRRLVDGNNPEIHQKPLPDGSNLEFPALRSSWVLQRAWVRALHYRGLHSGAQNYGINHIHHILALSMVLLDAEASRVINGVNELESLPEFDSLARCAHSLMQALNGVATDLGTEFRLVSGDIAHAPEETLEFNMEPKRLAMIYRANFDPVNKLWQLWAYLLALAAEFDRRMDREHVEDILMSKRVVSRDEFWDLSEELQGGHEPLDWASLYDGDVEDAIYSVLRKISQVNRHRRDFLLLRDWSYGRPWKQLYYIFNTAPGAQDFFLEPIDLFYGQINQLLELETNGSECKYKSPSPSSRANVWAHLFPIHPVAGSDPEKYSLGNCNYEGGCIICLENFEPSFIIMKLHCSHLFHYTCIRTMWDQPGIYTFSCPICRSDSVKWSLHEQAGIRPEVIDVWDNALMTGEDDARENPDVAETNDFYWMHENERLALSRSWNDDFGNSPRDVTVEMANVREARRRKNKRLRGHVPLQDRVEGLDPSS